MKNVMLVADSGATKTDWCLCAGSFRHKFRTAGMNVVSMSEAAVRSSLSDLVSQMGCDGAAAVTHIFFYGAGIVDSSYISLLEGMFREVFPSLVKVETASDLLAAARALFADGDGVVAISGTGSNSCLYRNGKIERNIRPGGFILGDEGSGAVLGRMFLSDLIKGLVPEDLVSEYAVGHATDYSTIVRDVYGSPAPSGHLAGVARFVISHMDHEYVLGLIRRNFTDFIERCLLRYGVSKVGVVGSLGLACSSVLEQLGAIYGLEFVKFIGSPIDGVADYHCNNVI